MLNNNEINLIENSLPFFNKLSAAEQNEIVKTATRVTYNKNTIIHKGLNECSGVVIVKSGVLRAYLLSEQGKEVTLFKLREGEVCVLTAGCIIENISFEIIISTETEAQLLVINKKVFDTLKQTNIMVEKFTSDIINQRFSDVMWAVEKILFLSFDKRLALFLLEQIEQDNSTTLKITHNEIANHLGTAREVVTRMLNYFASENWVQLGKGKIEILNEKSLKNLL